MILFFCTVYCKTFLLFLLSFFLNKTKNHFKNNNIMYEIMLRSHLIVTHMISTSYHCCISYVWNTWLRNKKNLNPSLFVPLMQVKFLTMPQYIWQYISKFFLSIPGQTRLKGGGKEAISPLAETLHPLSLPPPWDFKMNLGSKVILDPLNSFHKNSEFDPLWLENHKYFGRTLKLTFSPFEGF